MALDLKDIFDVHDVLDSIFNTVQDALDGDLQAILTIGLLLGLAQNVGLFRKRVSSKELPRYIYRLMVKNIPLEIYDKNTQRYVQVLSPQQLKAIDKLGKDLKWLKKTDLNTMQNINFKNAVRIADQIGSFGYIEATKAGEINAYKTAATEHKLNIQIPFVTQGDARVCRICRTLETNSPYPLNSYPGNPHSYCRCMPGEPIIK